MTQQITDHWRPLTDRMIRGLFSAKRSHLLLVGEPGVGRTALAQHLLGLISSGSVAFLKNATVRAIDCRELQSSDGALSAPAMAAVIHEQTSGVVMLDNLGAVVRLWPRVACQMLFARLLQSKSVQYVVVMTTKEFDALLANELDILERFTLVQIPEPDEQTAVRIAYAMADSIQRKSGIAIEPIAIERAVKLSAKYVWSQRLPKKAIQVLEEASENIAFEMAQCGGSLRSVAAEDVVRVISEASTIPVATLSGDIDDTKYEDILQASVVGQSDAVHAVAIELRLIRAGITEPDKPASVMLFCGQNGVGKTELAKKLAEIYSASKRLHVYTMGNFVEPHSVSGLIGVPAGYVGHDEGGRLVNDLLADPYGVFLIDEIEKAHPDVMKPFLNLFDEGWILDQRGVKAYAERAIFILTSNAGYEAISQMHQDRRPMHEIAEHVKRTLQMVRHERSSQPVLSTAFLARIKRIIVFNPLSEDSMIGIARILAEQSVKRWLEFRNKTVCIPASLVEQIGRIAYKRNEQSGGREGGRGVRRLIDDLVEDPIQRAAISRKHRFQQCGLIQLTLRTDESSLETTGALPPVEVCFR